MHIEKISNNLCDSPSLTTVHSSFQICISLPCFVTLEMGLINIFHLQMGTLRVINKDAKGHCSRKWLLFLLLDVKYSFTLCDCFNKDADWSIAG